VIKVEPRDGDATRSLGPFYHGEDGIETSLWWWAMNAGKRSVTCELRLAQGRKLMARLAATADLIVETFAPGTAAGFGLDYPTLAETNRGIVVTSITPFGSTGPRRDWLATDIVASAMGGHMHLNGDAELGPVRTLAPQAYTQVSVQAAVGALSALYARSVTGGLGQHVDVSMQEAMANAMDNAQPTWDIRGVNIGGPGLQRNIGGYVGMRYLFEASDGWVAALQAGGLVGPTANEMVDWLDEHGDAGELVSAEWRRKLTSQQPLGQDELEYVEARLAAFCRKKTKDALVAGAQERGSGWAPVLSPHEIVENAQLAARDYWVAVSHEDLGQSFFYPGAPWRLSATPWRQGGRAPHLGEHNDEVYGALGLSSAELRSLKLRMVI
jgi:crotonobetainyl-CoA:carnitine CoA-transferase CaiB-like acyl-CoA transferase